MGVYEDDLNIPTAMLMDKEPRIMRCPRILQMLPPAQAPLSSLYETLVRTSIVLPRRDFLAPAVSESFSRSPALLHAQVLCSA